MTIGAKSSDSQAPAVLSHDGGSSLQTVEEPGFNATLEPVIERMSGLLAACAEHGASGTLVCRHGSERLSLQLEAGRLINVNSHAASPSSKRRRRARARREDMVSGVLESASGDDARAEDDGCDTLGATRTGEHTPLPGVHARQRPLDPGTEIDKYTIEGLIGQGGNSHVYRGRHLLLDTPVAIKVLHPAMRSARPDRVDDLFNEARLAARLNHPNIVRVTDLINTGELLGVVMELVEGRTLRQLIAERGQIRPFDVISLGIDIASALGDAASYGLVHRDVKPSNIMLMTSGAAKLLDLGLAQRSLAGADASEHDDALRGTPLYMAPEQFLSPGQVSFRSDMFSLGITLYEALVGQPPFNSRSVSELIFKRAEQAVTPPHERAPRCPRALSLLIMELLQREPERRPRGYDVVVSRLRAMLERFDETPRAGPGDDDGSAHEDAREDADGDATRDSGFDPRHVLLVEDSRVNQVLIRRLLEEFKYRVSIASDGLEALEMVRTTRFGAILMDCELPRMNGYAATRLVRALEARSGHRTPIIALTAHILPGDRRRAQVAGMDDFLTKPVNRDRLEATLIHWQRRLGIC